MYENVTQIAVFNNPYLNHEHLQQICNLLHEAQSLS